MPKSVTFSAIAILALAYLLLGFLAFNPKVDDDYRAYYIEKTTSDWKPASYSARVTDGIDFSKPGMPEFIASISGLSHQESWGRWTDASLLHAARIVYKQPLTGRVCISIDASSARKQVGKVVEIRIGDQKVRFIPRTETPDRYQFETNLLTKTNVVEVEPRSPGLPSGWDINNSDKRRIGIGLRRLVIAPGECS
jgi:phosphoglycerol transferase